MIFWLKDGILGEILDIIRKILILYYMKEVAIQELASSQNMKELLGSYQENGVFHVTFSFESNFVNAKVIRDAIDGICSIMWLDSKWKTRIVLIVDELTNNAIEYGSSDDDTNKLEIYIAQDEQSIDIKISVQDSGNGAQAKTAQEMEQVRKERLEKWFKNHSSIRGRGLFMIIQNLVDALEFRDNDPQGLIVEVTKKLPIPQKK